MSPTLRYIIFLAITATALAFVVLANAADTPSLPHRTQGLDPQSQSYWRNIATKNKWCGNHVPQVIAEPGGGFLVLCYPAKLKTP